MRSQAVLLQLAKRSARISAFNGGGHILGMNSDDRERKQLKHSIFSDTVGGRIRGGGGGWVLTLFKSNIYHFSALFFRYGF